MDLTKVDGSSVAKGHKIIQSFAFYPHLTWSNIVQVSDCVDWYFISVLGWFDTSCYFRSKLPRLQHDCSRTWFQTLNLTQSNQIAVAGNRTTNKKAVFGTLKIAF